MIQILATQVLPIPSDLTHIERGFLDHHIAQTQRAVCQQQLGFLLNKTDPEKSQKLIPHSKQIIYPSVKCH